MAFLTDELIASLANYLNVNKIDVYEVATFYSMFNLNRWVKLQYLYVQMFHVC